MKARHFFLVTVMFSTASLTVAMQAKMESSPASDSAATIQEATKLRTEHREEEAAALLAGYLAKYPQDADALVLLARIRSDDGHSSEAKELLDRALRSSPDSIPANTMLGDLLLAEHRDPEAMDRFETILAIDLRNKEARSGELQAVVELAISARAKQRPDLALVALEHARSKLPDDPKLLLDLGLQANELGRLPEALDALQSARKLRPEDPDILYALARVETDEQHLPVAEQELRAYLVMKPDDATAHYGLGHVLAISQRPDEARIEFERSIQLQPVQTESYYQLGKIELDGQHDAQAETFFRKTLDRDPTHGGALTGMGILCFRRKQYEEAEQFLAKAEKTAPEYQPAHYYRGLSLAHLRRKDEADAELRISTELDRKQQGPLGAPAAATQNSETPHP